MSLFRPFAIILPQKVCTNQFLRHNQMRWVWLIPHAEKISRKTSETQGMQYKRPTIYAIKNAAPYKQVHDLPLLHTQHLYPHTI